MHTQKKCISNAIKQQFCKINQKHQHTCDKSSENSTHIHQLLDIIQNTRKKRLRMVVKEVNSQWEVDTAIQSLIVSTRQHGSMSFKENEPMPDQWHNTNHKLVI